MGTVCETPVGHASVEEIWEIDERLLTVLGLS
jgi:hypothetical protein